MWISEQTAIIDPISFPENLVGLSLRNKKKNYEETFIFIKLSPAVNYKK
jgi:hypothetical protein